MSFLLRAACHLGAALWVALFLAWRGLETPPPVVLPTVWLEPESPAPSPSEPASPEIASAAPTKPDEAPESPAAVEVGHADLARGESLLLGGGAFPALSFSYQSFPSFRAYALAMERLGARFVVVSHSRIVSGVDPVGRRLTREPALEDLSPRARDYSAEPALASLTREARRRFGADAEIMMLVPRRLDAGLFGGLARELQNRGTGPGAYRELRGRYERAPNGQVHLRVRDLERMDGGAERLDLLFDLSAIAGDRTT